MIYCGTASLFSILSRLFQLPHKTFHCTLGDEDDTNTTIIKTS